MFLKVKRETVGTKPNSMVAERHKHHNEPKKHSASRRLKTTTSYSSHGMFIDITVAISKARCSIVLTS